MRAVAYSLLAWLVFAAVLALGAMAIVVALVAAPVVLLAAAQVGGRRTRHRANRERDARGSVYEGEFRVLDETRVEHS